MKRISVPMFIVIIGSFSVTLLWVTYALMTYEIPIEKWGAFGDKFGALSCLFSGLAMVGVVAAFWHERDRAHDGDIEHRELLGQMRAQTDAMNRATQFQAKVHRLDRCLKQLASTGVQGSVGEFKEREQLKAEIASLQGELDRFSDTKY